jgi:NADH-quinone oxidoreductase subunit L
VALAGQAEGGHEPAAVPGDVSTERMLMAISTGIALAGIGIAFYFWLRRPSAAEAVQRRFIGVHRLLQNKYYVDEIYDAVIVQPIKQLSTGALWKGMDAGLIDGSVDGVGATVQGASSSLRRLQTGSVRTYAASLFFGAVLILGWYLWS